MRAEVVAIGTELLLGQIIDTNSAWIGEQLASAGIDCHRQVKVGDNLERMVDTLELAADGIKRTQFLHRLQGEITKRGVVDVLRKGVSHGPVHVDIYKLLPTPGNAVAAASNGRARQKRAA